MYLLVDISTLLLRGGDFLGSAITILTCTGKVHMKPNLFIHSYKLYRLKYMIPKFEMSRIKIGDFTSAESCAVLPRKMAFKPRGQNTT